MKFCLDMGAENVAVACWAAARAGHWKAAYICGRLIAPAEWEDIKCRHNAPGRRAKPSRRAETWDD